MLVAATDPRLSWMGRVRAWHDRVALAYPGIQLSLNWDGGPIALLFEATTPDCCFNVSIDGAGSEVLSIPEGPSTVPIDAGSADEHRLTLTRRTESWLGVATLHGVDVPSSGALLEPIPVPARRLLFVGDSITCGEAADKGAPPYPEGASSWNAQASYGMVAGRLLGAQVHLVAYGGRGLVRDWQGLDCGQTNNAPVFFERSLPDDPEAVWHHGSYQPDGVVVCLGANDFNLGIPDGSEWVSAYVRFALRIREVHPHAWLLLATCPLFSNRGQDAQKAAALTGYLSDVVAHRRSAGDGRISLIELPYQPGSTNDSHPTASQHEALGKVVAAELARVLRWERSGRKLSFP